KSLEMTSTPLVVPVNAFLLAFIDSTVDRVEFTPDDIRVEGVKDPMLSTLEGLDYHAIRCRLRVISGLNPVVNRNSETGVIQMTVRQHEVKLRSIFAAKAASIVLEKIET
ncbi:MAG TPA: hypothetical protein VHY09_04870, partial [Candidatus Methylacidiphilales bacterium]|nr:hypothetical protein [Candidatus Methylacidiphilales bacterium]